MHTRSSSSQHVCSTYAIDTTLLHWLTRYYYSGGTQGAGTEQGDKGGTVEAGLM